VNPTTIQKAIDMIPDAITPISDVRGSMTFRYRSAQNLLKKFFFEWQRENPNHDSIALSAK
jgi:xanthine dehydrogenase small subunit